MTLSVNSLMQNLGAAVYYEEPWHIALESHLLLLMQPSISTALVVTPHDAYKHEGDLHGLLQTYGQDPQYYFPIMRVNGMFSPFEYTADMTLLQIPSTQLIDQLRRLYMTISSKLA